MNFVNPFVLPKESYKRDINVFSHYVSDVAKYLSIMTGDSVDQCKKFVANEIKQRDTEFGIKDPVVEFFEREDNGDRAAKKCRFSTYLSSSVKNGDLIAPTLTAYLNPEIKKSILVDYVDGNVARRGVAKKAMFVAEMAGDTSGYKINKIKQTNFKLSNNALSGAHVSSSTPLFNKTSHSTLTSTCRSTSGYGNANNEKMLSGNRHYWSPEIVRNNIVSVVNNTNYANLKIVMDKYSLHYPTVQDVMDCIRFSSELYWRSKREYVMLERLVARLTDLERAAFTYTGDLYHLMKHNEIAVRNFIGDLSRHATVPHPDPDALFKMVPDDYKHLACQICEVETKGIPLNKLKGTPNYAIVAATAENIMLTVMNYSDFIGTFFVTSNVPASVAHFPDSIRRSALTSDTDSTIFTVQDWVEWYYGFIRFGPDGNAIAATMIFLAGQAITHVLAIMSANFGIEQSRLHQIAMKNEFKFDVFVPTQVAKHYFAIIGCQEGNLFSEYKTEIKGVHLKSSNAPKAIMKKAKDMMNEIMYAVVNGQKLSILKYLREIGDIERSVVDSIASGSSDYFRLGQIKTSSSYKNGAEGSPYGQFIMWNEVFGPKYGMVEEPPYSVIKISTDLSSPQKLNEWLARMEDRELAERLQNWLIKNNRKNLNTLLIPDIITQSRGLPKEIMEIIGVRKIVLDVSKVFYIILECLGIYMLNKNSTKLVSDSY